VVLFRTVFSGTALLPIDTNLSDKEVQEAYNARDVEAEQRIFATRMERAERLAGAIRFKTISMDEMELHQQPNDGVNVVDKNEFKRLHAYLRKCYPRVFKELEVHVINEFSLLLVWRGTQDRQEKPYLLIAHMDVVPCPEPEKWEVPPFDGVIKDGYVWGRGTIDDKQCVLGWLEAVQDLLESGFKPRRTIYFGFGHDEEINGFDGAFHISQWLAQNVGPKKAFEFVMDEGLFIIDGAIPGHKKPVAYICVSEKGDLTVELSVETPPGHSSNPPKETAVGILANAVRKIEQTPMPIRFHGSAANLIRSVSAGVSGIFRVLFSNLWLFGPIVGKVFSYLPGARTLVITTKAATMFHAGEKENVLPSVARAIVNHRVHPSETLEQVLEWDRRVVNDPRVRIRAIGQPVPPAPVSASDHPTYLGLAKSIHAVYGDTVATAPSLFVAASDSRHYWDHTDQILRFNPIALHNSEVGMFHGLNERIKIDNYCQLILVFRNVILNADQRRVPKEWIEPVAESESDQAVVEDNSRASRRGRRQADITEESNQEVAVPSRRRASRSRTRTK